MILVRALATPFVIAAVLLCCCGPAAEVAFPPMMERDPTELSGGYSLGRAFLSGLELLEPPYVHDEGKSYPIVVEQAVVRIGWHEEFILVEQHPLGGSIAPRPDSSNPRWHIVVVSSGKVYSNLTYESFVSLRASLGVPDTIEMRDAREVYAE